MKSHCYTENRQMCWQMWSMCWPAVLSKEATHELWQVPIKGQTGQQVIHPRVTVTSCDFCFAIGAKGERVSFNKWAEHKRRGEPQTPAAVLSRSYVTLMQTRLSAADVQPGSDGVLSHWRQHTAVKPFNAHSTLGAGWSIPAGLDANLRDMQRNVRQDGEDGGVGMNEEAD